MQVSVWQLYSDSREGSSTCQKPPCLNTMTSFIVIVGKYILLVSVCVTMSLGLDSCTYVTGTVCQRNYRDKTYICTLLHWPLYFWQIDLIVIISTPPTQTQHQYTLVMVPKPASSDAKVKDSSTVIYSEVNKDKLKPVVPSPGTVLVCIQRMLLIVGQYTVEPLNDNLL